jgi:hypothetical protein
MLKDISSIFSKFVWVGRTRRPANTRDELLVISEIDEMR